MNYQLPLAEEERAALDMKEITLTNINIAGMIWSGSGKLIVSRPDDDDGFSDLWEVWILVDFPDDRGGFHQDRARLAASSVRGLLQLKSPSGFRLDFPAPL